MDNNSPSKKDNQAPGFFSRFLNTLIGIGLGESMLRAGTTLLSIVLLGAVIWLLRLFYAQAPAVGDSSNALQTGPTAPVARIEDIPSQSGISFAGIPRLAQVHTTIPSRPREEVIKYTVVEGDTIFGIAEKFGLKPETVLWGNYYVLLDDPHALKPGQELNILPLDGTYHEWQENEGLNGISKYYGVTPEAIINFPANHLDPAKIGDLAHPNIAPGTWLVIPGGRREFISWSAPLGITRENPASARVLGPGACDPVSGGAVGYGTFVWPANKHYLSGFDYTPGANHWGIDIAGNEGEGVYATDAGVVVYAGWNNYGYGNMIMIDHGNNFQSLYGHLSAINVGCGQSVGQGDVIGAIGSTGRSTGSHLHFEIRAISSWVNPWDVLPPP
ncbi:MAG TPA: peptidoglycan DD-metalloendopeptidase family protein [Anaerolineales bacterium]|nr:peptidoglycan DD-metalloendopeptidase family protein [Anaerolineales bacterium]HLO34107.1 peptidoglycan DD-metalloendopeptidase family protein [Anaerolineales bacterium]